VGNWVGLLKKPLKTKHKERNPKSSTSLNPCWVGKLGGTVEKYSKTKREITKEQHITQSLLS
jgi:hypothetical protein